MTKKAIRKTNERFYDEYKIFDAMLCERFNIAEHGVSTYMKRMKEAVLEAREAIPEWDFTYDRLDRIQKRHAGLLRVLWTIWLGIRRAWFRSSPM